MRDGAPPFSSSLTEGGRKRNRGLLPILFITLCLVGGVAFLRKGDNAGGRDDGLSASGSEVPAIAPAKSPEAKSRVAKAEEKRIINEWGDLESRRLTIFGGRGKLEFGAIKALKITGPELAALDEAVSRMRQKTMEDFLGRTRLEEKEPMADGTTRYQFYTRARTDRGQELRDSMSKEVENILGLERAKAVMRGIEDLELPGEGGSKDMEIRVTDHGDRKSVKYRLINPKTGERGGGGESGSIQRLEDSYGAALELPWGE